MRIVALSDTHGFHKRLQVPDGDLLIHGGDFSMRAKGHEVLEFAKWIKSLPHPHKIVIAGNHDMACEGHDDWAKETFAPAIYLNHESCEVEGYRIFGSPFSSAIYDPSPWFFDYQRFGPRSQELWNQIPENLDVLITHSPPYGLGDKVHEAHKGEDPHVGDLNLFNRVKSVLPRIHIFGHIHEGYGRYTIDAWNYTRTTLFYNVCVCDGHYKPVNPITVIDL